MSNNYAEYFPILKYQNGVLTRVNGSGNIMSGKYTLFPLLSTNSDPIFDIDYNNYIHVKDVNVTTKIVKVLIKSLSFNTENIPDPCFLVATRHCGGYSIEELEYLNKFWDNLMSKLWKLKLKNLMKTL